MKKKTVTTYERPTTDERTYLALVRSVLTKARLQPKSLGDAPGFRVDVAKSNPPLPVFGLAYVLDDYRLFVFHLELKTRASKKTREHVQELITRCNWGLNVGNLELDLKTGRIRVKAYVDYRGTKLTGVYVRNAVLSSIEIVEAFGPSVIAVAKGKLTPKQAMAEIDKVQAASDE
ncbi:MAG: hypothetical protein JWP01_4275 [Myxococcales bacterium]|nr:hypothetical protein [Myxococcales bacterium]